MNSKELLNELKPLADNREITIQQIKKQTRPIILYGAAEKAKIVGDMLRMHNLPFNGYAVDSAYYREGTTYLGLPVFNLEELAKEPDKYVFIIAMESETAIERILKNKNFMIYNLDLNVIHIDQMNYNYVEEHADQFVETYNLFDDEMSRETFVSFIKVKISGDVHLFENVYDPNQYFNGVTAGFNAITRGGVFVDCGAWRGDTIEKFINWSQYNYKKIYGIEADTKNFQSLNDFVKTRDYKNIEVFNVGAWDKKDILYFSDEGSMGSSIGDKGVELKVDALDNLIVDGKVDFIKMDIEGAELPALHGAEHLIKQNKPYLAICAYHKARDLITLPQYIKKLNENYKFYLRQHMKFASIELVLYAIP